MKNYLLMLIVGSCMFLTIPEDASASWGITEVFYSGDSGIMSGYSATIRNEWDLGWSQCYWEEYDYDYELWYCADWGYYDFSYAVDSWLMRPSSEWLYIGRGLDYAFAGYGYGFYPWTEYGTWLGWGDHFIVRDQWYEFCWGSQFWQCSGLIYSGAYWFFLTSTSQERRVDAPYIHTENRDAGECDNVHEKGDQVTLLLANKATATNIKWSFVAFGRNSGISDQNLGGDKWEGVMARSGTATVTWDGGSSSCFILVGNRIWRSVRTPLIHPNGAPNNECGAPLTSPVVQVGTDINLGVYCGTVDYGPSTSSWTPISGGPNDGWLFFRNPPVVTTDWKMHPELINAMSPFSLANCGNSPFISHADLFFGVVRHERGTPGVGGMPDTDAESHHWLFGRILDQYVSPAPGWVNPGNYAEDIVWGPGDTFGFMTSTDRLLDAAQTLQTLLNQIKAYQDTHPGIPPVNRLPNGTTRTINVQNAQGNFQQC